MPSAHRNNIVTADFGKYTKKERSHRGKFYYYRDFGSYHRFCRVLHLQIKEKRQKMHRLPR